MRIRVWPCTYMRMGIHYTLMDIRVCFGSLISEWYCKTLRKPTFIGLKSSSSSTIHVYLTSKLISGVLYLTSISQALTSQYIYRLELSVWFTPQITSNYFVLLYFVFQSRLSRKTVVRRCWTLQIVE